MMEAFRRGLEQVVILGSRALMLVRIGSARPNQLAIL